MLHSPKCEALRATLISPSAGVQCSSGSSSLSGRARYSPRAFLSRDSLAIYCNWTSFVNPCNTGTHLLNCCKVQHPTHLCCNILGVWKILRWYSCFRTNISVSMFNEQCFIRHATIKSILENIFKHHVS